jgi:hypothetical protein
MDCRDVLAHGPTWMKAVEGVDYAIHAGETLDLIDFLRLRARPKGIILVFYIQRGRITEYRWPQLRLRHQTD